MALKVYTVKVIPKAGGFDIRVLGKSARGTPMLLGVTHIDADGSGRKPNKAQLERFLSLYTGPAQETP